MDGTSSLGNILNHPRVALLATIIFAALAFSGKFSITATRFLLFIAWIVATYSLFEFPQLKSRPWLLAVCAIGIGLFLSAMSLWAVPEAVPQNFGAITPRRKLLFSNIDSNRKPSFEIGDSGAIFRWGGPQGEPILKLWDDSHIIVENIKGVIKVTTEIRDRNGNLVATIYRNEWKSSLSAWDRNYNDDTFEVKDSRGRVVLQVKALEDRIQLQGEWWNANGQGIRFVKGREPVTGQMMAAFARLDAAHDPDEPKIQPLFEYPSNLHFGELKK